MRRDKAINPLKRRNMSFIKPAKFKEYLTISELSDAVSKDISWLRQLEKEGRIPQAARVKQGSLKVRLWSPAQVEEIRAILSEMRPGRPSNG